MSLSCSSQSCAAVDYFGTTMRYQVAHTEKIFISERVRVVFYQIIPLRIIAGEERVSREKKGSFVTYFGQGFVVSRLGGSK